MNWPSYPLKLSHHTSGPTHDFRAGIRADLREPADISAAVLPDFSQKHVYLHFHGRGATGREDANPHPDHRPRP